MWMNMQEKAPSGYWDIPREPDLTPEDPVAPCPALMPGLEGYV